MSIQRDVRLLNWTWKNRNNNSRSSPSSCYEAQGPRGLTQVCECCSFFVRGKKEMGDFCYLLYWPRRYSMIQLESSSFIIKILNHTANPNKWRSVKHFMTSPKHTNISFHHPSDPLPQALSLYVIDSVAG